MDPFQAVVQWLHVLGAIFWFGGTTLFGTELIMFFAIFTAMILMRFGL